MVRKKTPRKVETEVLVSSRRRCCLCFGLHRDLEEKRGQIAHLDHNNENSVVENLAWLCLDHHDQYDSKTSQSKNYTIGEVKRYRAELYSAFLEPIPVSLDPKTPASDLFETHNERTGMNALIEALSEHPSAGWSLGHLSAKLPMQRKTAERLLFLLSGEGTVRIDRQPGTTKQIYSLASSLENRLIDGFVASLGERIESDRRFLRKRLHEVDGLIETPTSTYAVETLFRRREISTPDALRRLKALNEAKVALQIEKAKSVLVIGIKSDTTQSDFELRRVEEDGALVRFIDLQQ